MQKKSKVGKGRWSFVALALACGLMLQCGGEDSSGEQEAPQSADAGALDCADGSVDCGKEGGESLVPESVVESCPGYSEKPNFPESYKTFCEEMVTQELIDSGNKCFFAPEVVESGCFCKICAIKGVSLRCVHEVCL